MEAETVGRLSFDEISNGGLLSAEPGHGLFGVVSGSGEGESQLPARRQADIAGKVGLPWG